MSMSTAPRSRPCSTAYKAQVRSGCQSDGSGGADDSTSYARV